MTDFHIDPDTVRPFPVGGDDRGVLWDIASVISTTTGVSAADLGTLEKIRFPAHKIVVPVDLQAFVAAGSGAASRADVRTATDPSATSVMPEPFTDLAPLAPGVHLHWAMPDALCRADPESNDDPDDLALPPVPDRWLIVRLGPFTKFGKRARRAWVVESDRASGAIDLESWKNTTATTAERLDVAAGGDVGWAAVYDNVVDRFAFHDDLSDAGRGPFSYVVIGWFNDGPDDPIQRLRHVGTLDDRLADLDWARVGGADSNPKGGEIDSPSRAGPFNVSDRALVVQSQRDKISRSVYHGAVFGVRTRAPRSADDPRPKAADVTMAFGANGATSLAALLTDDPEQHDVLAAIGAAAEDLLLDADGGDALAARMHSLGFLSAPGGTISEWVREAPVPHRSTQAGLIDAGALLDPAHPWASKVAEALSTDASVRGLNDAHERAKSLVREFAATTEASVDDGTGVTVGHDLRVIAETESMSVGTVGERSFDVMVTAESDLRLADLLEHAGGAVGDSRPGSDAPGGRGSGADVSAEFVEVNRPLPRFHRPTDPVVQLGGIGRSRRHGEDGRFDEHGKLLVRTSAQIVSGYRNLVSASALVDPLGHGSLPPEADALVAEAALLDPSTIAGASKPKFERRLSDETVRRHLDAERALTDLIIVGESSSWGLLDHSRRIGVTPSPVAMRRWAQPWVPIYVEWSAEAVTTASVEQGWSLGEVDREVEQSLDSDRYTATKVVGREVVTAGGAQALGDATIRFLVAEDLLDRAGRGVISESDERELAGVAQVLTHADLATIGLAGIEERLAGWTENSTVVAPGEDHIEPTPGGDARFVRAGAVRLTSMRVVDAFGRVLDLTDRLADARVSDDLLGAPDSAADLSDGPGPPLHLRPRITALSRLLFRLRDATDDAVDAGLDDRKPSSHLNPIAGWLLPDHADNAIELFDASGGPVGQLFHQGEGREVAYEGTPGEPWPMGGRPPRGSAAAPGFDHVARLADAILDIDARRRNDDDSDDADDAESPLSAMLRTIDTTLWTSDPLGNSGLEHPSILTGRPIAVVRAHLTLDVDDDTTEFDLAPDVAAQRRAAYAELEQRGFNVRLGSLGRLDDGLLGWYVDDDYEVFHPVHPAVRERALASGPNTGFLSSIELAAQHGIDPDVAPITIPYANGDHELVLFPNQTRTVTMLMHPGLGVHLTSGILPRKRIELVRQWTENALVTMLPSFRFGPVLVDPDVVRMPRVSARTSTQTWARRSEPGVWRDDPIVAATSTAHLPERPARLEEGWVRIRLDEEGS